MTECSSPTPSAPSCWLAGQALTAAAVLLPERLREHRARCPGLSRPSCSHSWESQARQRRPWSVHTVPQQARSLGTIPAGMSSPTSLPDSQHPCRGLLPPPQSWGSRGCPFLCSCGLTRYVLPVLPPAVRLCVHKVGLPTRVLIILGGLHKGGLDPPPRFRCGNVITVGKGRVGHRPSPQNVTLCPVRPWGAPASPGHLPQGLSQVPSGPPRLWAGGWGGGLPSPPSFWPAVGSYRIRERKFGVGFLSEWNLPWRLFILLYFYHVGHSPPLALNGSGFESFLQNYTTVSCFAVPWSPSVQRRGAALALPCWGAHVGLSTWPLPGGPGGCVSRGP